MPADPVLGSRAAIEAREARDLAAWAMPSICSRGRAHDCEPDPWRSPFQRDRDRIVHARAFRRLGYKTQVFVNEAGDLFRTRLTHTLEVAQLARAAGQRLALNLDLVECVALVHDIGHPPFGHRGEDMLDELLRDHGGFNHNRQALRIVEELEVRYPDCPGLNLSYELRESIVKHSWAPGGAGIPARFRPEESPLVEAQLVDAIDSIAYDCHDIDDGLRAGILELDALNEVGLWRGAWQQAVDGSPRATPRKLLIDRAVRILIDALLTDLVECSRQLLLGIGDPQAVRNARTPLIGLSGSMALAKSELEAWLMSHLYRDWRINRTFHKARSLVAELFAWFHRHADALPEEHQRRIPETGLERAVADYVSGMTDRFAIDEHRRLFGPGMLP